MRFNGINHLAMATGDMDATIRFWRDVRRHPVMGDAEPTALACEGAEPQPGRWPPVNSPTPPSRRRIYEGAGTELFHGKK